MQETKSKSNISAQTSTIAVPDVKKEINNENNKVSGNKGRGVFAKMFKHTSPRLANSFGAMLFLSGINSIIVIVSIVVLNQLPIKADQLREIKNMQLRSESGSDAEVVKSAIENSWHKVDLITSSLPDEDGIIHFVNFIDTFKKQGRIKSFSFASEGPVKDRYGYLTLPILVEIQGTNNEINDSLQLFYSLPYLFRTVTFDLDKLEEPGVFRTRIGGVIYVSNFGKEN